MLSALVFEFCYLVRSPGGAKSYLAGQDILRLL